MKRIFLSSSLCLSKQKALLPTTTSRMVPSSHMSHQAMMMFQQQYHQQNFSSNQSMMMPSTSSSDGANIPEPQLLYERFRNVKKPLKKKASYEQFVQTENKKVEDISLTNLKLPTPLKKKRRVGRGAGSGRGKYCGRGRGGIYSRSGINLPIGFEGGQTPLWRRIPKFGFRNGKFKLDYQEVNLEQIQYLIDSGRIDISDGKTITMRTLKEAGLIKNVKYPGIKLLSKGKEFFRSKVDIEVPKASKQAIKAIEKAGGSIRCIYVNKKSLHAMLNFERYVNNKGHLLSEEELKNPHIIYHKYMGMPPPKLLSYYMNEENRGYLAEFTKASSFEFYNDEQKQ
ncbi:hypothetical protein C9374_000590 [Naegleria lovaniensis]|uniref:Large ribosomal subunit protein uL15/eL18 domain-containing protein n=1 Tax=Naegleria lovaniensis TaxID=51637 RepID=A0AA88GU31_NAELO|nr:uncharacterized protein C9374_000590 [Naegleria lovaniensis]KAG2388426.1 hypothetical protein C9374_000590 [Naegleria lovaniensis]